MAYQTTPDDDIPSPDFRVRGFFNHKVPAEMNTLLREFLEVTGLRNEDRAFSKGMYLAQHPDAFNRPTPPEDGLNLDDEEQEMVALDRDPQKTRSSKKSGRLPTLQKPDLAKWHALPGILWRLVFVCALGATVQGFDEAAVNGGQVIYQDVFQIYIRAPTNTTIAGLPRSGTHAEDPPMPAKPYIVGLVNAAPYLCCVFSCWLTPFLNAMLGRRGTICLCALFSIFFTFAQAFANTWQELLVYRLLLGVGIGLKSATIPVYAAECAPANIRGSLVMFWQTFVALGVAAGCIISVFLHQSGDILDSHSCPLPGQPGFTGPESAQNLLSWHCSWNWRLILASPMVLPAFLAIMIYFCPESPRWTVAKAHKLHTLNQPRRAMVLYRKAFKDLDHLSRHRVLAARDMFSHFFLLREANNEIWRERDDPYQGWVRYKLTQLLGKKRNRRAITASSLCMFAQQFCGVNILIYYSNYALQRNTLRSLKSTLDSPLDARLSLRDTQSAFLYTMGFGIINFVFATPAFFLIDLVGRRTLLLTTFPFLALSNMITAMSFAFSGEAAKAIFLTGYYLFGIFYSPGEGPVPFVYAAECMPHYIRDEGMGLVTSINWFFNWLIAFTAPTFFQTFGDAGTFAWYAAWCVVLWFAILWLVPETRLLTLEQLEHVFNDVSTFDFFSHATRSFMYRTRLRSTPPELLYRPINDRRGTMQPYDPQSRPGTPVQQHPPSNNETIGLLPSHNPGNDFRMHDYGGQGTQAVLWSTHDHAMDQRTRWRGTTA